ncbi:MAG: hypothetical protein M3N18_09865 [Actinomycetota bacterium]|nr:hypothetical protein [Actinomycetota bacterium]
MGLKSKLARLQKAVQGNLSCIELADGGRYWYEPAAAWAEVFGHTSGCLLADYRGEPRPEPPEIVQAVARARDRRAAVGKLHASGTAPFLAFDPEALIERGELVPRSFLAGKERST